MKQFKQGFTKIFMAAIMAMLLVASGFFRLWNMPVYAASATGKVPIACYTLDGRVTTYTNTECSRISGYIDSVDLTKITAIYPDKGSVRVSYPTARGTKQAYARMSAFFSDISFNTTTGHTGKRLTAYRRSTGSASIGIVFAEDECIVIGQENGRTQLIYPTGGNNYKMGWVNGAYDFGSPSYKTNDIGGEFDVVFPKVNQETEKRSSVVSYMNSMATVAWTPSVDFRHWSYGQSGGNSMVWRAGTIYYGIPYSQNTRTTNLEKFRSYLSGNVYYGPSGQNTYLGSDCSSAVAMAYHTVNTSFHFASINTSALYPVAGYTKAVGEYYNNNWRSSSTVVRNNSKESIKNSYAQLQPGDLLLTDYPSPHVMMVTEAGSGHVKVTHQTTYKSSLHSTWRVGEQWSFDDLYNDKYIPVTMKEW